MKALILLWCVAAIAAAALPDPESLFDRLERGDIAGVRSAVAAARPDAATARFWEGMCRLHEGSYASAAELLEEDAGPAGVHAGRVAWFREYAVKLHRILADGYRSTTTAHFTVVYGSRDAVVAEPLCGRLEDIRRAIGDVLGYVPPDRIRVEIYRSVDEFAFASSLGREAVRSKGVVGICKFNRLMLLSPENLPFGYRWADTVAHEYVHAVLNRLSEGRLPLYLHEGIARYCESFHRSDTPLFALPGVLRRVRVAMESRSLIPFSRFQGSLVYLESQDQMELAYGQLALFVEYLIAHHGMARLVALVRAFRSNMTEHDVYIRVYGQPLTSLQQEWGRWLEERLRPAAKFRGAVTGVRLFSPEDADALIGVSAMQRVRLARRFIGMGRRSAAEHQFRRALDEEPYNPVVLTEYAAVLDEGGGAGVEELLQRCREANPDFAPAYALQLRRCIRTGDLSGAHEAFSSLIDLNPFDIRSRRAYAEALDHAGERERAVRSYRDLLILIPDDTQIARRLRALDERETEDGHELRR
jgi:tetratricopeptide (TPR) repeat protein